MIDHFTSRAGERAVLDMTIGLDGAVATPIGTRSGRSTRSTTVSGD